MFREEIQNYLDRQALRNAPTHIDETSVDLGFERAVRAIESQRPGWHAVGLEDLSRTDGNATLLMQTKHISANYRMVLFSPRTGQVFVDRMRFSGLLGFAMNLHFYLLAGSMGLIVSGWMALCLLLMCVTGMILWWPGVRRWAAALWLHRRTRWQRFNWDLHSVIGFWACVPLLLVTVTGVYFAFPSIVRSVVLFVTREHPSPVRSFTRQFFDRKKNLTVDEAIVAARHALPVNAPLGYLFIPPIADQPYSATGYYVGSLPYSQLVQVKLDSRTGSVLSRDDTREQAFGLQIIQLFFTLHFGSFGGTGFLNVMVKLLWVVLGIVPALLAVTGLLMYWNRKLSHLWPRERGL